ncbi:MAG: hypothetical protein QX199_10750 [Methylococcaceae bacterium]
MSISRLYSYPDKFNPVLRSGTAAKGKSFSGQLYPLQYGISLIELVLFIVIVSVAVSGVLSVINVANTGSVDPLIHKQTLTIAESLLEEIELQSFSNPNGGFTGAATQANRGSFDDIFDYHGFATAGIFPADGSLVGVPGLGGYNVNVAVVNAGADWGIAGGEVVSIIVTVTPPSGNPLTAVGYRFNY